jgi:hypothetical protein
MTTLACLYHWYTSAMFVVPVLAVGGWGWWSSRHLSNSAGGEDLTLECSDVTDALTAEHPNIFGGS